MTAAMAAGPLPALAQEPIPAAGLAKIQALLQEKRTRNAAQLKLDSQIHYSAKMERGEAIADGIPRMETAPAALELANDGLVHVDITADVSENLLAAIAAAGGRVESSHAQYQAIRAWMPLLACERIAERPDVRFIRPASRARTGSQQSRERQTIPRSVREASVRAQLARALPALRARRSMHPFPWFSMLFEIPPNWMIADKVGMIAHGADEVQGWGYDGTGVTIGVLSDGVDSLASEQAGGYLPPNVGVLTNQAGKGDEGTAMLEIVYSLAPGAQLAFATGFGGQASMADNIVGLRFNFGCDIIVDDVTYAADPAFQDGQIAQAINWVVGTGALYFSMAYNDGNMDSGTSSTWEGDYVDSGVPTGNLLHGETGEFHLFGPGNHIPNLLTGTSSAYSLTWSDPLGASCNDYDLFILDPTATSVEGASTNPQDCTQDPWEGISPNKDHPVANDSLIYVVNYGDGSGNAASRYLRVSAWGEHGLLSVATAGATFGHNAAASALTVAAINVGYAQGGLFTGIEYAPEAFSSDGPRRIFYDQNGAALTPGCFLASCNGGKLLSKVDFTAADAVTTDVPGFNRFSGTSAAAPHAAAIAALIKSANPFLTNAQVVNAMKTTALPFTGLVPGYSPFTVGAGIVMANLAVNSIRTSVTVDSSIQGLSFAISNTGCSPGTYTTPKTLILPQGASCTISFASAQANGTGMMAMFTDWSDGLMTSSRTINVTSTTATYTADFAQFYLLTLNVNPPGSGTVAANPWAFLPFYLANSIVGIQANAGPGYTFANFSGDLAGGANPQNVWMNKPKTVTANFRALPTAATGFAVRFGALTNVGNIVIPSSFSMLTSTRNRLPWQITGITVTFSAPIVTGNLNSLSGVTPTSLIGLGTNTLTWTITPLTLGNFTAVLASAGANALKDGNGNPISAFSQNIKVLYGDYNDDGYVNSADMVGVNLARSAPYNIFADIDGNGVVDLNDVNIVRAQIGHVLP